MSGSARIARGCAADSRLPVDVAWQEAPAPIAWVEPVGGAFREAARDLVLFFATLGLNHFWAKVRLRRRTWSAIQIDGAPLHYTGTVRDLLRPALIAAGVLVAMVAALAVAKYLAVPRPRVTPSPWRLLVSIPLVFMIGVRLWRARAYLLAHTGWKGMPGRLVGSPYPYAATHLAGAIALPLTLGWVLPWRQAAMLGQLAGGVEIAGRRVEIEGRPVIPWRRYWLPWLGVAAVYLGAVLTLAFTMGPKITGAVAARALPAFSPRDLAIIAALCVGSALAISGLAAWHRIGGLRAVVAAARFGGARLHLEVGDGAFVASAVASTAMKIASLGALSPHAEARLIRLLAMGLRAGP